MLLGAEEIKNLSNGPSLQYFLGNQRIGGLIPRMREDAEPKVHPLFRKSKPSYWAIVGIAAAGAYWASQSYKHWKEKKAMVNIIVKTDLFIQEDIISKMDLLLSIRKLETDCEASEYVKHRQEQYWLAVQKMKSEVEQNMNEDMKVLTTVKNLRLKAIDCKKMDRGTSCLDNLVKENVAVHREYMRRKQAMNIALKQAMCREDGSKIEAFTWRSMPQKQLPK